MASLSITSISWDGPRIEAILNGTVTKGQLVRHNGTGYVAATTASAAGAGAGGSPFPFGIALGTGASGDWIMVGYGEGTATINAVATDGTPYFLGDTTGGIAPIADVGAGEFVTYVGTGGSTTTIKCKFHCTGLDV